MKKFLKYKSKKNIIFKIVILVLFVFSILPVKNISYTNHYNSNTLFEDIIENESFIEDEFQASTDSDGIAIMIGTYMKTLERGQLDIKILDIQTNEELFNKTMSFSKINDTNYLNLKCKIEKDHKYKIKISINDININNRIVFSIAKTGNENTYKINDIIKKDNLNISYINNNSSYVNIWMLILVLILIYLLIKDKKEQ